MNKKYILIAEDDKFYANFYKRKFVQKDYEVNVVSNGKELLESLRIKLPDLILLDLIMPEMDGFAVLEEMKKDPKYKAINVIVMSNLSQEEDVKKVLALGAKEYLVKTDLSIEEMLTKVKRYLQ